MKPNKSYLSLYKEKNSLNRLLFILLGGQVGFLLLLQISLPIPVSLVQFLTQKYEADGIRIVVEGTKLSFPDQVSAKKVYLLKNDLKAIEISDLKLHVPILRWPWSDEDFVQGVFAAEATLYSMEEGQPSLMARNLNFKLIEESKHIFHSDLSSNNSSLEIKGIVDFKYLGSLLKATPLKKRDLPIRQSIENAQKYLAKYSRASSYTASVEMESFINCRSGATLCFAQEKRKDPLDPGAMDGFCAMLKITPQADHSHRADLKAKAQTLNLHGQSHQLRARDLAFSHPEYNFDYLNSMVLEGGESKLQVGGIDFKGSLQGSAPGFALVAKSGRDLSEGMIFSESNRTNIAVGFQWDSLLTFQGEILFKPKLFDLFYDTKKGRLRVMDGDEFSLALSRTKGSSKDLTPMGFRVSTPSFSVLETPDGKFSLEGTISPDYSIRVHSAFGKLGRCKVSGTYFQSWFPHKFRFLIKGECIPSDINNWFGNWWRTIWRDFEFPGTTPSGDFSIAGEWGTSGSNTITYGTVESGQLSYRDLLVSNSSILVRTDSNETSVSALATHPVGQLQGNLTFPRNSRSTGKLLSFDFNGEYPLNEGRKVFGTEVEKKLADLNATSLSCVARGMIFKPLGNTDGDGNETTYRIRLSGDRNISLWNIPVSEIHGEIQYEKKVTSGHFPSIGLGKGQASLVFTSEKLPTNNLLSFKFDLKKAERAALVSSLSGIKLLDPQSIKHIKDSAGGDGNSSGQVDFAIQAKGPLEDLMQFQGTGNFRLAEKSLSKVNLLGTISRKLDSIKLPIPSGTFSFEKLDVPFRLEYEQIHSDGILLTGPLSKLEASGRLNLLSGEIDLTSRLKLVGNLGIPILSNIIDLADPLSKITEIKIFGNWKKPETQINLNPFK